MSSRMRTLRGAYSRPARKPGPTCSYNRTRISANSITRCWAGALGLDAGVGTGALVCAAGLEALGSLGAGAAALADVDAAAVAAGAGLADGDFGPATKRAVIAAQRQFGIDADGIVGAATWARLPKPQA